MSRPSVFVTGAASGIGRATALQFARHGYRVGASDVDVQGNTIAVLTSQLAGALPRRERALR